METETLIALLVVLGLILLVGVAAAVVMGRKRRAERSHERRLQAEEQNRNARIQAAEADRMQAESDARAAHARQEAAVAERQAAEAEQVRARADDARKQARDLDPRHGDRREERTEVPRRDAEVHSTEERAT